LAKKQFSLNKFGPVLQNVDEINRDLIRYKDKDNLSDEHNRMTL